MRRLRIAALLGAALLGLAFLALRSEWIQDRMLERGARSAMGGGPGPELFGDDAIRVLVCGSASPLPHPTRARPCLAVFAGERFYVVDTGPGAWNRLALWRVPGERIGGVFLTHFHSDHIGELGEFDLQTWVAGRPGPLEVFGPPGVERVVAGFEAAYAQDAGYRIAHHGPELLSPERERMEARSVDPGAPGAQGSALALERDGLRVTAFRVDHAPVAPAVGYRFDYGGRSVVVSGDTRPHPGLVEIARGADLLVHEAQANHIVRVMEGVAAGRGQDRVAKILRDIPSYHTTPVEAAEIANQAGVRLLLLTHLTPPPTNAIVERIFLRGVEGVRPEGVVLARDGTLVELPLGSDAAVVLQLE